MTDQENEKIFKDPVKKEVFTKLEQVNQLLVEVNTTSIDGGLPYDASKAIANVASNPPEYNAMVDHLLEKTEELMQYIVNKGIS